MKRLLGNQEPFFQGRRMRGDVHSVWYSSILVEDDSLWCESSNPDEVVRMSKDKEVRYRKLVVYYDHDGWEPWSPEVKND